MSRVPAISDTNEKATHTEHLCGSLACPGITKSHVLASPQERMRYTQCVTVTG